MQVHQLLPSTRHKRYLSSTESEEQSRYGPPIHIKEGFVRASQEIDCLVEYENNSSKSPVLSHRRLESNLECEEAWRNSMNSNRLGDSLASSFNLHSRMQTASNELAAAAPSLIVDRMFGEEEGVSPRISRQPSFRESSAKQTMYEELMAAVSSLTREKSGLLSEVRELKQQLQVQQAQWLEGTRSKSSFRKRKDSEVESTEDNQKKRTSNSKNREECDVNDLESVCAQMRNDKQRLLDMNSRMTKAHDVLFTEHRQLKSSYESLKALYEQLQIDYSAALHREQEVCLQMSEDKSSSQLSTVYGSSTMNSTWNNTYNNNENENYSNYLKGSRRRSVVMLEKNAKLNNQDVVDVDVDDDSNVYTYLKKMQPLLLIAGERGSTGFSESEQRVVMQRKGRSKKDEEVVMPLQENRSYYNNQSQKKNEGILSELCGIFGVQRYEELVNCAKSLGKAVVAIPKLEAMLEMVTHILFGGEEMEGGKRNRRIGFVDEVLPRLRVWESEIQCIDRFVEFKNSLCRCLEISEERSTDRDILNAVTEAKRSRGRASSRTNTAGDAAVAAVGVHRRQASREEKSNNYAETRRSSTLSVGYEMVVEQLRAMGINGDFENSIAKVSLIRMQLNDLERFLKVVKALLNIPEETTHDVTLTLVLRFVENASS